MGMPPAHRLVPQHRSYKKCHRKFRRKLGLRLVLSSQNNLQIPEEFSNKSYQSRHRSRTRFLLTEEKRGEIGARLEEIAARLEEIGARLQESPTKPLVRTAHERRVTA